MVEKSKKMNPEVKELWVKELRSGDFVQGTGSLRTTDNKCCCLGVLCELAYEAGVIDEPTMGISKFIYEGDVTQMPPSAVMRWSGIYVSGGAVTLAAMNDRGESFEKIADYIEENL